MGGRLKKGNTGKKLSIWKKTMAAGDWRALKLKQGEAKPGEEHKKAERKAPAVCLPPRKMPLKDAVAHFALRRIQQEEEAMALRRNEAILAYAHKRHLLYQAEASGGEDGERGPAVK